jgi:enamine deaminase RidA (YjgF/YER057c/UK114 family)
MKIKKLNPKSLRIPTKAYSQGVLVSGQSETLYITGQLAQDIDGNVVAPNDVEEQTRVVFSRIEEILKDADMTFENVVKLQIFLKDIKDSKVVSAIRDEIFKDIKPASLMLEVSNFLKDEYMIEIEAVAVK